MAGTIKLKAKLDAGVVEVKALIQHPMDTGLAKDSKGELIPAHYIDEVIITANDKEVAKAAWSGSISKNPYIAVMYKGAAGDKIKLTWKDNKGESDSAEIEVKAD